MCTLPWLLGRLRSKVAERAITEAGLGKDAYEGGGGGGGGVRVRVCLHVHVCRVLRV